MTSRLWAIVRAWWHGRRRRRYDHAWSDECVCLACRRCELGDEFWLFTCPSCGGDAPLIPIRITDGVVFIRGRSDSWLVT